MSFPHDTLLPDFPAAAPSVSRDTEAALADELPQLVDSIDDVGLAAGGKNEGANTNSTDTMATAAAVDTTTASGNGWCTVCNCEVKIGNEVMHDSGRAHARNVATHLGRIGHGQKDTTWCDACQCNVSTANFGEHCAGRQHQKALVSRAGAAGSAALADTGVGAAKDAPLSWCRVCECPVSTTNREEHAKGQAHMTKLAQWHKAGTTFGGLDDVFDLDTNGWCDLCQCSVGEKNMEMHLSGKVHQKNLARATGTPAPALSPEVVTTLPGRVWCPACQVQVTTGSWTQHCQGRSHENNSRRFDGGDCTISAPASTAAAPVIASGRCRLCECEVLPGNEALHEQGRKHKRLLAAEGAAPTVSQGGSKRTRDPPQFDYTTSPPPPPVFAGPNSPPPQTHQNYQGAHQHHAAAQHHHAHHGAATQSQNLTTQHHAAHHHAAHHHNHQHQHQPQHQPPQIGHRSTATRAAPITDHSSAPTASRGRMPDVHSAPPSSAARVSSPRIYDTTVPSHYAEPTGQRSWTAGGGKGPTLTISSATEAMQGPPWPQTVRRNVVMPDLSTLYAEVVDPDTGAVAQCGYRLGDKGYERLLVARVVEWEAQRAREQEEDDHAEAMDIAAGRGVGAPLEPAALICKGSVRPDAVVHVCRETPMLRHLSAVYCGLTQAHLREIAFACRYLEVLDIRGSALTVELLVEKVELLPRLKYLNIIDNPAANAASQPALLRVVEQFGVSRPGLLVDFQTGQ